MRLGKVLATKRIIRGVDPDTGEPAHIDAGQWGWMRLIDALQAQHDGEATLTPGLECNRRVIPDPKKGRGTKRPGGAKPKAGSKPKTYDRRDLTAEEASIVHPEPYD